MKNYKQLKVVIGIPSNGYIRAETITSLIEAISYLKDSEVIVSCPTGCHIHQLREYLAEQSLQLGATHLMFIDSDMIFEPQGIIKLIKADKPIIGGDYNYKLTPKMSVTKIDPEKIDKKYIEEDPNFPGYLRLKENNRPDFPFEVKAIATGFMLIKTEVFQKIKKPWFWFDIEDEKLVGEDLYFCQKARKENISIWCEPTIKIGHLGIKIY
jgi:choline kinase